MNVLVAGGAGLVGAAVARGLLAEETDVVVADDFGEEGDGRTVKEWRLQRLGADPRLAVERVDLADAQALADLFGRRRPAAVVNAALFDPAGPGAGPLMFAARAAGTGLFVHLSDGALYAPGPEPERPAREDEPLDAAGEVGLAAKLEEERLLAELGLPFVALRLFEVLGPMFPPRRFPVVPLEAILAGEEVLYEESGWRDVVHIDDAVRGVLLSLRRRPIGKAVNLGGGLLVNPRTLLALLAREAGRELRIRVTPPPGPLRPRRPANLERARTELGWAPAFTVGEIVESLVSARVGRSAARRRPAPAAGARERAARVREPARAVSRRELFGLFRRPFRGPGR
jgi:nucleoside-diphosphate-sugar epimerase